MGAGCFCNGVFHGPLVKWLKLVSIHRCGPSLISMLTSGLMEGRQLGRQQEKAAGGAGHNNQQLQTTGLYQGHRDEEKDKGKDKLKTTNRIKDTVMKKRQVKNNQQVQTTGLHQGKGTNKRGRKLTTYILVKMYFSSSFFSHMKRGTMLVLGRLACTHLPKTKKSPFLEPFSPRTLHCCFHSSMKTKKRTS